MEYWIFGDNLEDRFGHVKFSIFYLLCGLAATSAQLVFSLDSNIPNLGASGAIAGVLGAYILLFPKAKVSVLQGQRVVPVPALIVIGLWFVLQLFSSQYFRYRRRGLHGTHRRICSWFGAGFIVKRKAKITYPGDSNFPSHRGHLARAFFKRVRLKRRIR